MSSDTGLVGQNNIVRVIVEVDEKRYYDLATVCNWQDDLDKFFIKLLSMRLRDLARFSENNPG